MGMDNTTPTMAELATSNGIELATAQKRVNRAGLQWSAGSPVTPEIADILNGGKRTVKKTATKRAASLQVVDNTDRQTAQSKTKTDKEQPTKTDKKTAEWWQIIVVCFFVSLLSVTLTILGLSMFAQWAGTILGGMFALYLLASVLVSRNRLKGDTSEQALKTVLYMEIGASVLHGFTFYTLLPDTHNELRITAAVLMAGFVAFLSYKTVLFVRTYNAEI